MTWRNSSACLDESPELFFPIGDTRHAVLQIEAAKAVCRRCTVAAICLAWAIEAHQDEGVWSGMSEAGGHGGCCLRRCRPRVAGGGGPLECPAPQVSTCTGGWARRFLGDGHT
ncbi:MAG: WhiB family transcriptional regulator [Dermatophilaceae bacterium]|nr:WhiB family transcriptional regulator [Dermatophilaceae bacterium]